MGQTIQFKRGTTDRWDVKKDTILKAGEPGYDVAKHKLKIGDGIMLGQNFLMLMTRIYLVLL